MIPRVFKEEIKKILRVNHAGEIAAVKIYEGQIKGIHHSPVELNKEFNIEKIHEMLETEKNHKDELEELLIKYNVRPSLINPLWKVMSTSLGFISGIMGEKASYAFTASVEEVIDDHYHQQITEISKMIDQLSQINDQESLKLQEDLSILLKKITKIREDEIAHMNDAKDMEAHKAPLYGIISKIVKFGCRTAIALSKEI